MDPSATGSSTKHLSRPDELLHSSYIRDICASSPIIAPQARRGAFDLEKTRRLRGTPLCENQSPRQHRQGYRPARSATVTLLHPIESMHSVAAALRSMILSADVAFRHPDTGQRLWNPPWLRAYTPLLVWVAVSLTSTLIVLAWHKQVFQALDSLAKHLQELGMAGRLILGALIFLTTFPPLPLYSTLIVLSGFTFGLLQGFIVSYTAALAGAVIVFVLSRSLLRAWMLSLLDQGGGLKNVVRAIDKRPRLLFLIRLAPYPYNLMNTLLASAPTLTLRTYTLCTAMALPKLLVHCALGTSIKNFAAYNGALNSPESTASGGVGAGEASKGENRTAGALLKAGNTQVSSSANEAAASETAELIKHAAGFLGVALCVGIFVYLFRVARRAVDEELEGIESHEHGLLLSDEDESGNDEEEDQGVGS